MAINAREREIELILTYKCNWDCEYCCVDTHNRKPLSMEIVKEKLKKVIPGYNVTLSGGEVGTMKEDDIKYIIEYLEGINCPLSLNTNGLFLERYPHLTKHFEYILYHCSEDLETNPNWDAIEMCEYHGSGKIDLMLVVTDNNIHRLDDYLTRLDQDTFHVVAATLADGGLDVTLSNRNRYAIMAKNYRNVTKESLKRLIIKEKDFDRIIYI